MWCRHRLHGQEAQRPAQYLSRGLAQGGHQGAGSSDRGAGEVRHPLRGHRPRGLQPDGCNPPDGPCTRRGSLAQSYGAGKGLQRAEARCRVRDGIRHRGQQVRGPGRVSGFQALLRELAQCRPTGCQTQFQEEEPQRDRLVPGRLRRWSGAVRRPPISRQAATMAWE